MTRPKKGSQWIMKRRQGYGVPKRLCFVVRTFKYGKTWCVRTQGQKQSTLKLRVFLRDYEPYTSFKQDL